MPSSWTSQQCHTKEKGAPYSQAPEPDFSLNVSSSGGTRDQELPTNNHGERENQEKVLTKVSCELVWDSELLSADPVSISPRSTGCLWNESKQMRQLPLKARRSSESVDGIQAPAVLRCLTRTLTIEWRDQDNFP